jgi:hypothetical protein
MGCGDNDDFPAWCCMCGLTFNSYEARHDHRCPPTKQELLMKAADKVVEAAEKVLVDYKYLHQSYFGTAWLGVLEEAIEEYKRHK